ncbi:MAG: hypothetical protein H6Q90_1701 [Deltaproteobacteria bacterium]|nr:hypothetical protein [Deltaproteobacteria bacterium]
MSYRLLVVFVVGCASAAGPASETPGVDAAKPDSPPIEVDAAPPCTMIASELLVNGSFDASPEGTGWTATPVDPGFPLITQDDAASGVVEKSPLDKVWLGGFAQANADDQMFQDVVIPAGTSELRVTGFYWTKTGDSATVKNDTATLQVTSTTGTVIDPVVALDNTVVHTDWQPLDHAVPGAAGLSGQTVRIKFASHNNTTLTTSFWFDTLSLQATHCQ